MIERIKHIRNPLTVIAIFAALAEVAGTVGLATIDVTLQATVAWYVMGFPILLVVLFFLTLNFNPSVLYAPSDFQNEENFLKVVLKGRAIRAELDEIAARLDTAVQDLVVAAGQGGRVADAEGVLQQNLTRALKDIRNQLAHTQAATSELVSDTAQLPRSGMQAKILEWVGSLREPVSISDVAAAMRMSVPATTRAIDRLAKRAFLERTGDRVAVPGSRPTVP